MNGGTNERGRETSDVILSGRVFVTTPVTGAMEIPFPAPFQYQEAQTPISPVGPLLAETKDCGQCYPSLGARVRWPRSPARTEASADYSELYYPGNSSLFEF